MNSKFPLLWIPDDLKVSNEKALGMYVIDLKITIEIKAR